MQYYRDPAAFQSVSGILRSQDKWRWHCVDLRVFAVPNGTPFSPRPELWDRGLRRHSIETILLVNACYCHCTFRESLQELSHSCSRSDEVGKSG